MFSDDQLAQAKTRVAINELIGRDVALKRKGREWSGLCPFHNEKSPSFYVVPDKEMFHCFGCGVHGSSIDYVMRARNVDFKEAVRQLLELPVAAPQMTRQKVTRPEPQQDKERDIAAARAVLQQSIPITERTAPWLYLWSRGLPTRQPGLRAHNALKVTETGTVLPALIAPLKNGEGHVTAIQRIWCLPRVDSEAKDSRAPLQARKKTLGVMGDGCVRLAAAEPMMGLAEGVETAIAASMLYRVPVWATCGAARMASVWLPSVVEHLVIFGDNGATGIDLAHHAADEQAKKRKSMVVENIFPKIEFGDFNDQLLAKRAAA